MTMTSGLLRSLFALAWIVAALPVALASNHCAPKLLERAERIDGGIGLALARVAPGTPAGDIHAVAALPDEAFIPLPRSGTAARDGQSTWIRLCLQGTPAAPENWVLAILPAYVDRITLYEPDGADFRVRMRDRSRGIDDSEYSYRGTAFRLTPGSETASVHYLEVRPRSLVTLDFLLFDDVSLAHFVAMEYGGFGLYLGMMLLVALINLIFWHRLRDRVHLYYASAILSIAAFAVVVGGYLQQFVPVLEAYYPQTFIVTYVLSAVLFTRFVLEAFRARLYYPRLRRAGHALLVILVILGLLVVLDIDPGFNAARAARLLVGAGLVAFALTSVHAIIRHRSIRLYAIALMPLTLSLLSVAANRFGLTDFPMSEHLPHLGALVHLVLLNFALVRRTERAERGRERATLSALRTAQAAERVLESRVRERTHELDITNDSLRHEIFERTAAQKRLGELLEAERRALYGQRQFVAMLSHELRTPLTVIDAAAQGLVSDVAASEHGRKRVERIRRSVHRLIVFIENLLAEERIDAPTSIRMRPHDLAAALRERYPARPDQRIRLDLRRERVELTCDPDLIGIVVSNLADNALKYSPASEPVELSLDCDDDHVVVEVRDYGPGIAPEEAERVFERYYRAGNGQVSRGIGLGLYLCREIARRHGGEVTLSVPEHAGGTRARLRLPRHPQELAPTRGEFLRDATSA